ncbi:MAG: energy transducer TonB, partial [Pseudomonadota bacterium]|nr:energy transducer TonB [Pseudomonadota bacterium]
FTLLLAQWCLADINESKDKKPGLHFSKPSKPATADLKMLAKIAAPDNPKSDFKKALEKAAKIQTEPDFDQYTHLDLAFFFGYLGWLNSKTGDFPAAISYYTFAVDNYSPHDQRAYNIAIKQLLALSVEANQVDKVYNDLHLQHFPSLTLWDLLTFAELYSQSMRFDLAQKLFSLADKKSQSSDDYDRYLYFATYIKNAALHKNQEALDKLAAQYSAENKTIKWSQLISWKKQIDMPSYPVVKVAPDYPNSAIKRRVSGYSVVEYSVDIQGKTKDIIIIEEHPEGYFEKTSIAAAKKFLYKPFIGPDGIPAERRGLRNKFTYAIQ